MHLLIKGADMTNKTTRKGRSTLESTPAFSRGVSLKTSPEKMAGKH
jgi:hypothetical protein